METLRIRKFGARYHLPAAARDERERLDRVLREIVNGALELAVERAGILPGEEICVRDLSVPVRLRLGTTDAALIAAWSLALAEAIRRAATGAPVAGVIRYTSRVQALVDMAAGALAGNFERAWAWRQLDIWRTGDPPGPAATAAEVVRALLAEPEFIVAVLLSLAGPKVPPATLARFAVAAAPEHWTRLARAALEAAGLSGELIAQAEPGVAEIPQPVRRLLENSALARALTAQPRPEWQPALTAEATVRRPIAILIALEADPGVLRASGKRVRAIVGAVADALYPVQAHLDLPPTTEHRPHPSPDRPAASARTGKETPAPGTAPDRETPAATDRARQTKDLPEEEPAIPDLRRRALTRYGGVLFLLHIVADLELAAEIPSLPAFAARSFHWAMQQLALSIIPGAETDDPAVLAFSGLVPDSVPPSRGEPLANDAERDALAALRARIAAELEQRVRREEETLDSVCLRQAEIVADPGWIEVHLSLTEVSTAVRRAGLDLDLGYLPWLGVVVRFVYE